MSRKEIVKSYMVKLSLLPYQRMLKNMPKYGKILNQIDDFLNGQINDIDIENFFMKYDEYVMINTSYNLFPGDVVKVYPGIRTFKSKEKILCDFSKNPILGGSEYLVYRPMLNNLTTKSTYVLDKSIRVLPEFYDILPKDIYTLDEFDRRLTDSYNLQEVNGINYYDISINMKRDSLVLKKLRKN